MDFHPLLLFVHVAGVVVWVGGMFFAYVCQRPEAASQLEPPPRLRLWRGCWRASSPGVGCGGCGAGERLALLLRIGFAAAPPHQHLMLLMGLVMIAIYVFVYSVPYAAPEQGGRGRGGKAGGAALRRIRQLVGTNLTLGFLTIAMGDRALAGLSRSARSRRCGGHPCTPLVATAGSGEP